MYFEDIRLQDDTFGTWNHEIKIAGIISVFDCRPNPAVRTEASDLQGPTLTRLKNHQKLPWTTSVLLWQMKRWFPKSYKFISIFAMWKDVE